MKIFRFLIVLMVCLLPFFAVAQDVITLKSGDEIQAKVTEVGQSEIKYKRFDNPDGPVYSIGKGEVFMIKYENGSKDIIKYEEPVQSTSKKDDDDDGEFWKPYKWTNQRIAGISLFADLGGFCFSGSRYGLELRYRRWQVNGFFKYSTVSLMSKEYLHDTRYPGVDPSINSGYGGGFTVKFLFPLGKSKSTLHIGVINEWSDYDYEFSNTDYGSYTNRWFTRNCMWKTTASISGLGFGYSYHTDKGFYFTIGGYWGVFVCNGDYYIEKYYHDAVNDITWDRDSDTWVNFFGTAEVTLGWEFCLYRKK
ncbi:MAG: hypothetical protein J6T48_09395 [Bacteroidales bacterium]|nr:hypothetical protein [Bacteroidales bacterium]